jgi:predicted small lipoprotein YifL
MIEKQKVRSGSPMKCSQIFAAERASRAFRLFHTVRAVTALAAVAALAGCGSSSPLFASDGSPTTLVQCPSGSDSCEQQAAANCSGGGYEVVRQTVESGVRNLLYACKRK